MQDDILAGKTPHFAVKPARETNRLLVSALAWAIDSGQMTMTADMSGIIIFCQEVIIGIYPRMTCFAIHIAGAEHDTFVQ